ncbi:MAG: hypothetical protein KDC90_09150 [Ignavibacteriae bacterium]|nr:hypothetical protein [Ignavibacteriota bacterium]
MKQDFDLKIIYNKTRTSFYFIMGITWSLLGLGYFFSSKHDFLGYLNLALGLLHFAVSYYSKHYGYLTISNDIIKKRDHPFFNKSIAIKDITGIGKIHGDYVLKTETEKIRIDTSVISVESKKALENFINDLENSIKESHEKSA